MDSLTPANARSDSPAQLTRSTSSAVHADQSAEFQSFERALERARERDSAMAAPSRDSVLEQPKLSPAHGDTHADVPAEELKESETDVGVPAEASATQAPVGNALHNALRLQFIGEELLETAMGDTSVSSLSSAHSGEIQTESRAIPASAHTMQSSQGVLNAENLAALLTRMERAPGASNGVWNFGVLGDGANVASVQLQKNQQGGWRVNVSLSAASQVDVLQDAQALQTALIGYGHEIESVQIESDSPG